MVYPTHLRATGNGTCGAFGRIGAITTPLIAQVLIHSSVRHTAAVYATSAALGIVATLLLPYETAGRAMVR
ncbi:putative transporter svop-1 [Amphibalanus amphitrite]|uniref:Putative transporter svop-1 n=1 Tax=Amphibalanus amphitrite TaxID=1232801 RepID=A0A6A4WYL5_AMPAM|nr:putative transporter svop-1 [Amphibalanus amphitrite]